MYIEIQLLSRYIENSSSTECINYYILIDNYE